MMFLPVRTTAIALVALLAGASALPARAADVRRINAPLVASPVPYPEAAVAWFGQVEASRNYSDVRVAYTTTELWVSLSVFDQWLWEDDAATRTAASLEQWDAATLLIDKRPAGATTPGAESYRFVGELNWWRPRTDYQAAYVGSGTGWTLQPSLAFTTEAGWRGDAPNTTGASGADRGWTLTFHIPFSSLGLSGPPPAGTVWRLGFQVHDKDTSATPAVTDTYWPETLVRDQSATWGELGFGLRTYSAPTAAAPQTYTIRHLLNGATVSDAMVGGGATCGSSDYFNVWGGLNHTGSTTLNIQNQSDVADWPCFSKTYLTFPLSALPAGKTVVSATLTLYQFGGSEPTQAERSLIQVLTVNAPWTDPTITWNNAPLAVENVAQSWVDPLLTTPAWPGVARTWDVSWALAQSYASGQGVVRLALYEADSAYHSGKYFTSSETGDWNAVGRPTLQVVLGDAGVPPPTPPTNLRIVP